MRRVMLRLRCLLRDLSLPAMLLGFLAKLRPLAACSSSVGSFKFKLSIGSSLGILSSSEQSSSTCFFRILLRDRIMEPVKLARLEPVLLPRIALEMSSETSRGACIFVANRRCRLRTQGTALSGAHTGRACSVVVEPCSGSLCSSPFCGGNRSTTGPWVVWVLLAIDYGNRQGTRTTFSVTELAVQKGGLMALMGLLKGCIPNLNKRNPSVWGLPSI